MRITLVIMVRDGRVGRTVTPVTDDLQAVAGFIAALGTKHSDAEFTITAANGPGFVGRFGDVVSVRLDVSMCDPMGNPV
jgi:hypothetical protein